MSIRRGVGAATLLLLGCGRALSVNAEVVGVKPGAPSIVLVRVKTNNGATVECAPEGLRCDKKDVGATGQVELEVSPGTGAPGPATVIIVAKHGPREGRATVVLDASSGLAPSVAVGAEGLVSCVVKACTGAVAIAPAARVKIRTEPGTLVEIGSSKITADAQGNIEAPFELPPSSALQGVKLATLCAPKPTALGAVPLTLTFPDKAKATTSIAVGTALAVRGLSATYADLSKGPVPFGWEKGAVAPTNKRAALYVSGPTCSGGGAADATLADVRVVALGTDRPRQGTCDYKITDLKTQKDQGNAKASVTLHDIEAKAYDRVTGAMLGTRTFQASTECDGTRAVQGSQLSKQDNYADPGPVAAWAATLGR